MLKYLFQRLFFGFLTLIIIIIVVYLSVAIFSENYFAKKSVSLAAGSGNSGSNIQSIKILYQRSVDFHLTKDLGNNFIHHVDDWAKFKVNPIIRLFYWFKDLFNKAHPFGLPFNESLLSNSGAKTIPQFFFSYLKFSIIITVPAFIISAILGIILGIIAGYKRGTIFDSGINAFALFFIALPSFVIAPIAISLSFELGINNRFLNPYDQTTVQVEGISKVVLSWIPPILILVLGSLSVYITYIRNQIITVLTSNYVLIAKSKGLSQTEIFFKYVLRNISIPLATLLIPSYIGLLTGGIVIERYWQVPGVSYVITQAFPDGEINLIMFNTVFFTTLSIFTTILVDISYVFLDPRIKYSSASDKSYWMRFKAYRARELIFKNYEKGVENDQ